ncbi:MAG: DNA repair protein RecN [Gemmatimonadales bacterium]|nr:MAG: DNA repair protein RecN [Gemmatimonadales bacterium]
MLLELRIRDFAVIQDLAVELGPGLNVLTGETGAGKSILLGALSLLLGERASSDSVRAGADRALVEAVFDLSDRPLVRQRLAESGFEPEDGLLVLRREVQAAGRNRAWINGSPATAGTVGDFGSRLVDLHGQHEHQTLLEPEEQRSILDAFAGAGDAARAVREAYLRLSELKGLRDQREARQRELAARADFLRFQLEEIRAARPRADEDEEVEAELRRLDHAEELARSAGEAHDLLYDDQGSASERLSRVRDILQRLSRFDESLADLRDQVETAYHLTTELGRSLGDYAADVEVDPGRAEELRRRSDLLAGLKRKYGPELADVLSTGERLAAELDELESGQMELEGVERAVEAAAGELQACAATLTEARTEAARRLETAMEALLPDLGLAGAVFRVVLEATAEVSAHGRERVEFQVSLNEGFVPRPLARIASGGELSRVMLALKRILATVDQVPTLIFDEIDAGIGGVVATFVARKLREVAEHHQVLVITHLAQLASVGHRHLRVQKTTLDGLAATTLVPLEDEARVEEIARMLGGDPQSATSRTHARELLNGPAAWG